MKSLWTLIKLYVNSIYRFPVIRYSKDPRERRQAIMGVAAIFIIVVVYGGMSGMTTARMLGLGIDPAIPFLMISALSSLFALVMAFAQGSATLSGFADFDTLMGMPVKTSTVVLARFSALYLAELVYSAAYLVPCGAVYAVLQGPAWWFYPAFVLMLLVVPMLPITVGSGLDLLLSAAFAKSKYKKGVTSAIKMILLLGFVVFAYMLPNLSNSFMTAPAETAGAASRIYPPAGWFAKGATGDPLYALLFIGVSAAVCALFLLILNKTFLPLHGRLTAGYHVENYRIGALKRTGAFSALFRVERKRFFGSTAWVINTGFGALLLLALGVAGAALSGTLSRVIRLVSLDAYVASILTGLLTFCATLAPTTAVAISMEGKELWIAKTLPVSAKLWLRAKLFMNLVLMGPALLISATLLAIFYRGCFDAWSVLGLFLAPVAALLLSTVAGLFVNVKMPRFSWKSDAEVVKQSGSVLVAMLIGFVLTAAAVLPALLSGIGPLSVAAAGALLLGAFALYGGLMKNAEQIRRNL